MTKLIGIHGAARSGKDTLAKMIMGREPYIRMAFADPLKTAVATLFDIPLEQAFSDDKSQIIDKWGLTLRDILQRFGTEAMRNNFGDDFWIKRWRIEFERYTTHGVVLTDVRFENEADTVREMGGLVVHLERKGGGLQGSASQHASERGLLKHPLDHVVVNNGTLDDLSAQVPALLIRV